MEIHIRIHQFEYKTETPEQRHPAPQCSRLPLMQPVGVWLEQTVRHIAHVRWFYPRTRRSGSSSPIRGTDPRSKLKHSKANDSDCVRSGMHFSDPCATEGSDALCTDRTPSMLSCNRLLNKRECVCDPVFAADFLAQILGSLLNCRIGSHDAKRVSQLLCGQFFLWNRLATGH